MSDLRKAIAFHLGRDIEPSELTYYAILGVEKDADVETIKLHWKAAATAWNASDRKSDPQRAQRVAALLKEAQVILLDPAKRVTYDASLAKKLEPAKASTQGGAPSLPRSNQTDPKIARFAHLFPEFDPLEPFQPSQFRKSGEVESPESIESRLQSLLTMIRLETELPAEELLPVPVGFQRVDIRKKKPKSQPTILYGTIAAGVLLLIGFGTYQIWPASDSPPAPLPNESEAQTTTPVVEPEKEDLPRWTVAMEEGRNALLERDFSRFRTAMESASSLSVASEFQGKQKRLEQVGELYEEAVQRFEEGKSAIKANDHLRIGSDQFEVIAVDENQLTLRMAEKNESFYWDKLPLGVLLAIFDQSKNSDQPTDLASRAVYLSFVPNANELVEKRVEDYFSQAAGKGNIRSDLQSFFTE